jgi:hypothetical protein
MYLCWCPKARLLKLVDTQASTVHSKLRTSLKRLVRTTCVVLQITFDILRRRLNMENPHKQWLAVDLVRHVLGACGERLRPFRGDLIREVARVADKPNKKGSLPAQQNARKSALEFLQSCGQEGHQALTLVQSMQRGMPVNKNRPMHPMALQGMQGPYGTPYQTVPGGQPGSACPLAVSAVLHCRPVTSSSWCLVLVSLLPWASQ